MYVWRVRIQRRRIFPNAPKPTEYADQTLAAGAVVDMYEVDANRLPPRVRRSPTRTNQCGDERVADRSTTKASITKPVIDGATARVMSNDRRHTRSVRMRVTRT